jgi:hypothetical protein
MKAQRKQRQPTELNASTIEPLKAVGKLPRNTALVNCSG